MKLKHTLGVALLTFGVAASAFSFEKTANLKEFNDFEVRMLAARDARDHQNLVFQDALDTGKWEALVYLGQIGGEEACARIEPYLSHRDRKAVAAARKGAAWCHENAPSDALMVHTQALPYNVAVDYLPVAMGFSGKADLHPMLVEAVNSVPVTTPKMEFATMDRTLPFFGLLQSIVYDRLPASAFPTLKFDHVLAHTGEESTGFAAAYLLTRFIDLPEVLTYEQVTGAMAKAPTSDIRTALVRVLRQYDNVATDQLTSLAEGDDEAVAFEAIRAMGYLSDDATLVYLQHAFAQGSAHRRHLALSSLAARGDGGELIGMILADAVSDANPWLAVTALRGLNARSPEEGQKIAASWFAGDDYYKSFSAMSLLAGTDEGKAILEEYAAANPDTIRGREAAIALDPSIEGVEKPRKTPSWNMVLSYQSREMKLETTRGTVCIAPSGDAPYSAANFMLLADLGKMNGMLWHRVIPNFVAQAGQSEDPELGTWGTIREEWDGMHTLGSVGVATAGRDTGSAQFFINTAHNMHLTGRYTVFGQVTSGMDAAMALQEGDIIIGAETVPVGQCK